MPTSGSGASPSSGALPRAGAAAGGAAVALFLIGGALAGTPEDFGGPPASAVAYLTGEPDRIQLGSVCFAASAPLLLWFLASAAGAGRAGLVALTCGTASIALFLADVAALVVATLRPGNMRAAPELAAALLDFSFVAIAAAAFLTAAVFADLAWRPLWPPALRLALLAAAAACALRVGTLLTTEGPFTAGGPLGFWIPVAGYVGGIGAASLVLTRQLRK